MKKALLAEIINAGKWETELLTRYQLLCEQATRIPWGQDAPEWEMMRSEQELIRALSDIDKHIANIKKKLLEMQPILDEKLIPPSADI